jgi:drug/metabolite transporter (DMT)-like permease
MISAQGTHGWQTISRVEDVCLDLGLEGIGQRQVSRKRGIGVSACGRVRVGLRHFVVLDSCHRIRDGANCSGWFFSELYLFWFEFLWDGVRVKPFSIAAPGIAFVRNRPPEWQSWFFTALGVLCFSFTFPMTRLSLRAFDPILIALVRGSGAGTAALVYLTLSRSRTPDRRQMVRLVSAALGMVVLFPIFVSIALKSVPATHASVLGSILPLATAVFGVVRGRESVSRGFWILAILGTSLIGLFSAYRSGFHSIEQADVLLVAAFIACSYGYAEGSLLAREMGGWRVICWALVSVLPLELVALIGYGSHAGVRMDSAPAEAWAGLLYLTVVSQFIGFFFYYKGLALGGIAKMSQVQLLLPFVAIFAAHWVLGEQIDGSVIIGTLAITTIIAAGAASRRVSAGHGGPVMSVLADPGPSR